MLDDPADKGIDTVRPVRDNLVRRIRGLLAEFGIPVSWPRYPARPGYGRQVPRTRAKVLLSWAAPLTSAANSAAQPHVLSRSTISAKSTERNRQPSARLLRARPGRVASYGAHSSSTSQSPGGPRHAAARPGSAPLRGWGAPEQSLLVRSSSRIMRRRLVRAPSSSEAVRWRRAALSSVACWSWSAS